jgi:hypothetical protein
MMMMCGERYIKDFKLLDHENGVSIVGDACGRCQFKPDIRILSDKEVSLLRRERAREMLDANKNMP